MTRTGTGRSPPRIGIERIAGQSGTEMIVILVLVAFAAVAVVTLYGRNVGKKFSCAGQSVANGGGAAAGCSGEASGGVEVDAISGADPRAASPTPGAGTAAGGAVQRTRGEAARPDILPVLPTPRGGLNTTRQDRGGQPAAVADLPVIPSSGGESRSASSGAPRGRSGKAAVADDLADFLKPRGGSVAEVLPQLAADESLVANAPGLPSVGGGSGTAPGGTTQQGARQAVVIDIPPPVFKGDGGPGTAPVSTSLQTFDELVSAGPNAPAFPGSSFGGGASRQDLNDLILGGRPLQRLNDAAGDLRKVPDGEARVNGIIDRGTIIEVKGADGSSKFFRVDNPFKTVRDDTFGRVPTDTTFRDRSKVIVEEADAKSAADPSRPRIVVNDQQTTGEIALELFRQRGPIRLDPQLDSSVRAGVDADDRAKARQDFVKKFVDLEARRAFDDIQVKKELERQGATVTTTLPFEAEHNAAFNKAFAEELGKGTGAKAAVDAGTNAAARAVTDAVERGGVVADRVGKAFDQRFDQFVKENPDKVKEGERRRRTDDLIKGLAGLVNKVDPKSPKADKVIELVGAVVPLLSGADQIRFLNAADQGLERLLGPFGFRVVAGPDTSALQRDRLEYALAVHASLEKEERDLVRQFPIEGIKRHRIRVLPTEAELRAEDRIVAIRKLPDGTLHEGPLSEFREAVEQNRINHALEQLAAIRGGGPGALIGRIVDGERGAAIGGLVDAGLPIVASRRARANVRAGIKNSTSGGHVVRGGPGGAGFEPVSGPGVRAADRLVPPPRSNVREVGPDLAKRPATLPGAGPQPPRPPAPPKSPVEPGKTGNPPAQNRPGEQTNPGSDTTGAVRREKAQREAAEARQNAQRAGEQFRRDLSNPKPIFGGDRQPGVGEPVGIDKALKDAEAGKTKIVTSGNEKSHELFFKDAIRFREGEKPPPAPVAFTEGNNRVRVDDSRLNGAQLARLRKIVAAEEAAKQGRGGSPPKPPDRPGGGAVDARANTELDRTRPAPPPKPQSPPKSPDKSEVEPQTVRSQRSGGAERKTGEITRPGVVPKGAATGKGAEDVPGKFSNKDVVFGLSVGDPKKGPVAKFAGKALNAANPDHLPLSGKATTPQGIADETVGAARTVLAASGGTLRFSLAKFDVNEALTPGSEHFNTTTSIEFRRVLTDPFFRGRVRFYDDKGVDITESIVKRSVPKVTSR